MAGWGSRGRRHTQLPEGSTRVSLYTESRDLHVSLVFMVTSSPWALEGLVDTGCAQLGAEQGWEATQR